MMGFVWGAGLALVLVAYALQAGRAKNLEKLVIEQSALLAQCQQRMADDERFIAQLQKTNSLLISEHFLLTYDTSAHHKSVIRLIEAEKYHAKLVAWMN